MSGKKRVYLENREGCKLTVLLREYQRRDEPGMIACIRDEYGDTYFKRNFYQPEQIWEEAKSGHITFLVAETEDKEIAGMLILKQFYPEESMCEIASQIFLKKYRGYGLATPFFEYGMEILKSRHYSAAYCLPVLFHDTTQRLLYRLGLRACGFVLNVFDMDKITHSYERDRNRKHSQGIQIMALEKKDVGMLYLPCAYQDFCRRVYDTLGVAYQIEEDERTGFSGCIHKLPDKSDITYQQDDIQKSLEICIRCIGEDLTERMESLHREYPLKGKQTANVFLNINDRYAVRAYGALTGMGYFFTGLKPLCSNREYMVLHHVGEMKCYPEDYVLSDEFQKLLWAAGMEEKICRLI